MTEREFDKKCKEVTLLVEKHLGFEVCLHSEDNVVLIYTDKIKGKEWMCKMEPTCMQYAFGNRFLYSKTITDKISKREMADDILNCLYGALYNEYRAVTIRRLYNKSGTVGFQIFRGNKIYFIDCNSAVFKKALVKARNNGEPNIKKKLIGMTKDSYEVESVEHEMKRYVNMSKIFVKDLRVLNGLLKWLEEEIKDD